MLMEWLEPSIEKGVRKNNCEVTLRAARVSAGYTVEEAAKKMNISIETLNEREKDAGDIPLDNAIALTELYRIPFDLVYFGKESDYIERKHIIQATV